MSDRGRAQSVTAEVLHPFQLAQLGEAVNALIRCRRSAGVRSRPLRADAACRSRSLRGPEHGLDRREVGSDERLLRVGLAVSVRRPGAQPLERTSAGALSRTTASNRGQNRLWSAPCRRRRERPRHASRAVPRSGPGASAARPVRRVASPRRRSRRSPCRRRRGRRRASSADTDDFPTPDIPVINTTATRQRYPPAPA